MAAGISSAWEISEQRERIRAVNFHSIAKWAPLFFCLGLISCTASTYQTESRGWVMMNYYTDQEKGIRGLQPLELGENVDVVQEVFPGSIEELQEEVLKQINIEQFPASIGKYHGKALSWDLYSFEGQLQDVGPFDVAVNLAVAEGDSVSYFVVMLALPEDYGANTEKYESVFYHSLYAFSPLE
jgi:hypothetical protein